MPTSLTLETNKRALALNLGLDPDAPRSNLGEVMLTEVGIGLEQILTILANSSREEAGKIVAKWNRLTADEREMVTFDLLLASVKMTPADALGMLASEMYTQSASVATLIAAMATPEVMKATIEAAKDTRLGHADRKMLLQASGNAVIPKNQTTINNIRDSTFKTNNVQVNVPSLGATASMIDALDGE